MIWGLIVALAVLQSWFGVGLLLVGTPILLLSGVVYQDALWMLLPCSFTVSTLQLFIDRRVSPKVARSVLLYAVPPLLIGLAINLRVGVRLNLGLPVAGLLAMAAVLRLSTRAAARVRDLAASHERAILGLIGLIHGLTNMGGSLLLQQAASQHVDKLDIRQHVAIGYVVFASIQLAVLLLTGGNRFTPETAGMSSVAGATFLLVGRRSFVAFGQRSYTVVLSGFMLLVAGMLVWRA